MTNTIKVTINVPPELWQRLKDQAERNHRSINGEMAAILEAIKPPATR